jgi:integrase
MTTDHATRRGARKRGHGEGTIYQHPTRGWVAQLSHTDGKRKTFYGKTRKEVAEKLARAQADVRRGLPLPDERQTLAQFLDRWMVDIARPRLKPQTVTRYAIDVRRIKASALGRLRLGEVTPRRIQTFLNDIAVTLSPRSVHHCRAVLRSALSQAEEWSMISRNAARLVTPPRTVKRKIEGMTHGQAQAIIDAFAAHPLGPLVTLALGTGLRQGELLGLRWQDIDEQAGHITVRGQVQRIGGRLVYVETKTDEGAHRVPLPDFARDALREQRRRRAEARLLAGEKWQGADDYIFTSRRGAVLSGPDVTQRFQKQLVRAGLPRMPFHDLRHGVASLLLAEGATLKDVQEQLGHSQIATTADIYAHLTDAMRRRNATRLDRAMRRREA